MRNLKKITTVLALMLSVCLLMSACTSQTNNKINTSATEDQIIAEDINNGDLSDEASIDDTNTDTSETETEDDEATAKNAEVISSSEIPDYSGEQTIVVNNNIPYFDSEELNMPKEFEEYSELDSLGRCGVAFASVSPYTMPTEERGEIGMIKPSGWHTIKYDWVDGKFLYNRCHLIGFQLAGENANDKNLITGTRSFNAGNNGMLPYENEIANYVKQTGYHVWYRVTPVFEGDNLLAKGVLMEAESQEDDGAGVKFNIFVYNVEDGVEIDYATGDSWPSGSAQNNTETVSDDTEGTYVVNLSSMKFHRPDCVHVDEISDKNKKTYKGKRNSLINNGYEPCKTCNP